MSVKVLMLVGDARRIKCADQTIPAANQPTLSRFCLADADFNRWFGIGVGCLWDALPQCLPSVA